MRPQKWNQDLVNKAKTVSSKNTTGGSAAFKDRRPESLAQRKIKQGMMHSPQVTQLKETQKIIHSGTRPNKMTQAVRQRSPLQFVSDEEVNTARNACRAESVASVEHYSHGWKRKANATKKRIFEAVLANEDTWYDNVDHIMSGNDSAPPTGYHSKALGAAANAEGVGTKNPGNVGGKGVYKQWTKQRGQVGNANLKISTFFPDNWEEAKVRACALLSFSANHGMSDQLNLDSPGGATFYPTSGLANPDQP